MSYTGQQIATDIQAYITKGGGGYKAWYVGISRDPRKRLFNDHAVSEVGDWWIYRQASTSEVARSVEAFFIDQCGSDGGPGGGDGDATSVYAYKKNSHTNP